VALVRTSVSEEHITSIMVKRISKLGTMIPVTSNVPAKRQLLQEPHSVTFQKMAFFIVTAVKTSNLTM
jgi:hypothetical protein